jgi:hypothetical protein
LDRRELQNGDAPQFVERASLAGQAPGEREVSDVGEGKPKIGVAALQGLDVGDGARARPCLNRNGRRALRVRASETLAERIEPPARRAGRESQGRGNGCL